MRDKAVNRRKKMRKIINTAICLLLVLAMTVPAFADTSQGTATTLKLEKTEGKVNITKSAGKSVTVKDGIRLYDGYTVKTDKNSKAYVSLDQSKAIMLDASTTCSIKKSGKKLEIMLQSGTVLVNVEDKLAGDEELNIRTTNSVTGIRGTIAQFNFNSTTKNTEVYLFEGKTSGTYLAPDGSWYTQELVSGSWLASGKGMLADHPQYNGWTLQEDGSWLYTNNNINSPANASYFWGKETGWFMKDAMTGETDTRTAWPFTFPMLEPAVQKEIINDESMLKRGQEHLDLYPELAEKKLKDTKKAADESLIAKTEEAEKRDEAIQELYDKGTASVDNLFKNTAPSVPTYAVRYYKNNDLTELLQTRYFEEGEAVDQPTDLIKGYTITGWSMQDPDSGTYIPVATMGTAEIDCWPDTITANPYTVTIHNNTVGTANETSVRRATNAYGTVITGTGDEYTVTFDDESLNLLLNAAAEAARYTVRDGAGKYYAADGTGVYTIPINKEADIDLYIDEAADVRVINISFSIQTGEITEYSGKVIALETLPTGGYTAYVDGDGGVTATIKGGWFDGKRYGVRTVTPDGGDPITPSAYDRMSGTYTITESVGVLFEPVYRVSFGGDTGKYTVENDRFSYEGENYIMGEMINFAVDSNVVSITDPDTAEDNVLIRMTDEMGVTTDVDSASLEVITPDAPDTIYRFQLTPTDGAHYDIYFINKVEVWYDPAEEGSFALNPNTKYLKLDDTELASVYYVEQGSVFEFTATCDTDPDLPLVYDYDNYTHSGNSWAVTVNQDIEIWANIAP